MDQVFNNLDLMKLIYVYITPKDLYNLALINRYHHKYIFYVLKVVKHCLNGWIFISINDIKSLYYRDNNIHKLLNVNFTIYRYKTNFGLGSVFRSISKDFTSAIIYTSNPGKNLAIINYPPIFNNLSKYLTSYEFYNLSLVSKEFKMFKIILKKNRNIFEREYRFWGKNGRMIYYI